MIRKNELNHKSCTNATDEKTVNNSVYEDANPFNDRSYCPNHEVEKSMGVCYDDNERLECCDMSLVIMACVNEGIVAVADEKSTYYINKEPQKEIERYATKIFLFNNFILGTFGANTVNDSKIEIIIEEIRRNVPDCTYESFLARFQSKLLFSKDYKTFNFIVGYKNNSNHYCLKGYRVNCEHIEWDKGYAESSTNNTILKNETVLNLCNFDFPPYLSIEDTKSILIRIVEDTIEIGDKVLRYNPVGGKVDSLVFK